ncbi:ExbD/TolR family protein [Hoylesella enoeca]|uniref:Biopolymer transporter ExbD n=1 Tax=Hoylesella enoeca TaxID=76123 RepID=A0A0S2KJ52_9BACT|nr:biopolymer transporter ExbD [Hoylesella enoeca]ALO48343.1 biopolymer transporter ExbD [Hoylesella enoeca]
MSMFRRRTHSVPGLNTSSLPDLIFTVLFFFMIVTHMRKTVLKVHIQVPQGTELTRLTKKSAVSYIYIGTPSQDMQTIAGTSTRIQLNDKFASPADIIDYIEAEQNRMSPEDRQQMTVSIKADKHTKMGVMTDVKQALRQAKALRVSYSAVSRK